MGKGLRLPVPYGAVQRAQWRVGTGRRRARHGKAGRGAREHTDTHSHIHAAPYPLTRTQRANSTVPSSCQGQPHKITAQNQGNHEATHSHSPHERTLYERQAHTRQCQQSTQDTNARHTGRVQKRQSTVGGRSVQSGHHPLKEGGGCQNSLLTSLPCEDYSRLREPGLPRFPASRCRRLPTSFRCWSHSCHSGTRWASQRRSR